MSELQKHHIIDLFVWVDDQLDELGIGDRLGVNGGRPTGRPPSMSSSEIITIAIWSGLTESHKTMKHVYQWIKREYSDCFHRLPAYKNFVLLIHRNLGNMTNLLLATLNYSAHLRLLDSTMLPVCKLARADRHKVAKGVADFGKNHQGWHYGFKLHAGIDKEGHFTGLCFSAANIYDAQRMEKLIWGDTKIVVGDRLYGASVMTKKIYKNHGVITIAPPHPKQNKKIMTKTQHKLLKLRTKIEAVFDNLKEHMNLVTSFPRSVKGYFVHYIRILLGYQMKMLGGVS